MWARISLMGHGSMYGRISPETGALGVPLMKVEVCGMKRGDSDQPLLTKYIGASAIYSVEEVSETTCRRETEDYPPLPNTSDPEREQGFQEDWEEFNSLRQLAAHHPQLDLDSMRPLHWLLNGAKPKQVKKVIEYYRSEFDTTEPPF